MEIIYYLDLLGTFSFAVSGAVSAAKKKFDLFGALFIASVTSIGGGTVRDVITGNCPVFWITDANYFGAVIIAAALTYLFARRIARYEGFLLIFDAIGIGVFTLVGMQKAINLGIPQYFAIVMGVITAVMGGIFRDVFCNDVPLILQKEIYATACFLGAVFYLVLQKLQISQPLSVYISILLIIAVRLFSIKLKLSLPKMPA